MHARARARARSRALALSSLGKQHAVLDVEGKPSGEARLRFHYLVLNDRNELLSALLALLLPLSRCPPPGCWLLALVVATGR